MENELSLSFGHAFVAPDQRRHRSSMAVQVPDQPAQLSAKGGCAVIADSTWRNAIARQAGDLSVRGFLADYFSTPEHWDVKTSATRVLRALNGWCFSQSRFVTDGSYVSSLSAVVFRGEEAHLFHMGDTLVFRLRGAEFEQLSRDHVTDLGGYRYPSRALGMDGSIDIDYLSMPLKQGDIFLFTTQAVRGTLLPSDYVQLIRQNASDLDAACERLAHFASERALDRGYGAEAFCFQLVRVDRLPEPHGEPGFQRYDTLPIPSEMEPGDRLDGFEVEAVLSRNAKARVYRVRDMERGTRLIMKAPSPELSQRNAYLEHFMLQHWVASRAKSPFVVKVVDPPRPRRYLYYLMRDVGGVTLDQWLQTHPAAGLEQRLDIARQLAKAVHSLHRRELLHQAIRPENVMLDPHEQVVLIDFGACSRREDDMHGEAVRLAREVGLSVHSAPEYALESQVSRRSDQFSLASTIYWLLSGELPYDYPMTSLRQPAELSQLRYRSIRTFNPAIPKTLDVALKRALSPQRALRYRRLSEFVHALRQIPEEVDSNADTASEASSRRPIWREPANLWQMIAGVLLLLLLLSWWLN